MSLVASDQMDLALSQCEIVCCEHEHHFDDRPLEFIFYGLGGQGLGCCGCEAEMLGLRELWVKGLGG